MKAPRSITEYWLAHYVHPTLHLCSLCGNQGIIDTTLSAESAAGVKPGMQNFCICPNGQKLRSVSNSPLLTTTSSYAC